MRCPHPGIATNPLDADFDFSVNRRLSYSKTHSPRRKSENQPPLWVLSCECVWKGKPQRLELTLQTRPRGRE